MKTKICTKCGIEKSLDEFPFNKNYKDGKSYWCKKCKNNTRKEYNKKYSWKVTFNSIKWRCNNPKCKRYKDYGGRGIKCLITVEELKKLWFRDKAFLMNKPSIDRKNNNGNYIFENCRYIELNINSVKDKFKPVNQCDLNGNFIKNWKSQAEIQHILGLHQGNISLCCLRKRKTAYKFIWKFANEDSK